MAKLLLGSIESRLLSAKVMPTVPSIPVTTRSASWTGMPTLTGSRSEPRSLCAAARTTLTSPPCAASAAALTLNRITARLARICPSRGSFLTDSIMPRREPPTRDKCPYRNVSCTAERASVDRRVPGGVLRPGRRRPRPLPAPERRPGGAFHQHRAPWSPGRLRRPRVGEPACPAGRRRDHVRGHRRAVQSARLHRPAGEDRGSGRTPHPRTERGTRVRLPFRPQSNPPRARAIAFARVDMPALRAFATAGVERGEERRQVGDDVLHVDLDAMHQCPALRAVPLEGVVHFTGPDFLHHEADRARPRPLRRMAVVPRQQDDLAFLYRNLRRPAVLDHVEHDVAA